MEDNPKKFNNNIKICEICNNEFEKQNNRQKFCSTKCYNQKVKNNYDGQHIVSCQFCNEKFRSNSLPEHELECLYRSEKIENINYVICKICNIRGRAIVTHIQQIHKLSKEEYIIKYDKNVLCKESSEIHSELGKISGNWITRAKDAGEDLTEYKEKLSKAIIAGAAKSSIEVKMQQSARIKSFNETIGSTPEHRKLISDSTKTVLSKPENIKKRENSFIGVFQSKGEVFLRKYIQNKYLGFEHQSFISSDLFEANISKRKQVDLVNFEEKIIIEYDGEHHFREVFYNKKVHDFEKTKELDIALEKYAKDNSFMLIKVSYDSFSYKRKVIKEIPLKSIDDLLANKTPGVFYVGSKYEKNKIS